MSHLREFSTNQRRALAALLCSPSVAAAADRCGLSERTLFRYLRHEPFLVELRRREIELFESAGRYMLVELHRTIDVLRELRDSPDVPPGVRHRACVSLINSPIDLQSLSVERRVVALEELLSENRQPW